MSQLPSLMICSCLLVFSSRGVTLAAAAAAFRPPAIRDELGCSPTLSVLLGRDYQKEPFFFDPLGVSNDSNFSRLREGELKCCRIAMLAMVETIAMPFLVRFHIIVSESSLPSSSSSASASSAPRGLFLGGGESSFGDGVGGEGYDNYYSGAGGGVLDRLAHVTVLDAAKVLVACFILETLVFVQRDPKALPGDYGTGYFGVRDKGLHEKSLISELENGRLAMMALILQIATEKLFGMSWDKQWILLFKQWIEQQQV